jgi:hypothetical protein
MANVGASRTPLGEPAPHGTTSHLPRAETSGAPVPQPLFYETSVTFQPRSKWASHIGPSLSPPPPAPLPRAAAQVAAAYAKAIYTWSTEESVLQWFASFSTLVTPAWWRAFNSADPTPPSRATTVVVQRVLAAQAPQGHVAAEVLFTIAPGGRRALLVDLVERKSVWLVSSHS